MRAPDTASNHTTGNLVALNTWLSSIGVQPITAWRWRRKGWLTTVNICGRVYVSRDTIAEFERRAAAGDFAQPPTGCAAATKFTTPHGGRR